MKDRIWVLVYVILGSLAVLMLLFTIMLVTTHEQQVNTPCEELVRQNSGNSYKPLPKRCEKGE